MEGLQGFRFNKQNADISTSQRGSLESADPIHSDASTNHNGHSPDRQQPPFPDHVVDGLYLIDVFADVLDDEFTILGDLLDCCSLAVSKILASAVLVWMLYAWKLCGHNQDICNNEWLYRMPLRVSSTHGLRATFFGYCWCFISSISVLLAGFPGIPRTFWEARLATNLTTRPEMSNWQRNKTYAFNFINIGIAKVVQPLFFYFVSRGAGQSFASDGKYVEHAVYVWLALQCIKISLMVIEKVAADRGWIHPRLALIFVLGLGLGLGMAGTGVYLHDGTLQQSWTAAQQFRILGDEAERMNSVSMSSKAL